MSLSSALFSAFALQLSAQSQLEVPKAPATIEPGLEKAVEWKWWPVASDSVKNWATPAPTPNVTVQGQPGMPANGPSGVGPNVQEPRPREYEVKKGDALVLIGKKFGISGQQLKEFNGLTKDTIQIGQKLKIPTIEEVMAMAPPPPPKKEGSKKEPATEEGGDSQTPKAPAMLPPGQEDLLMQIYLDREGYSCGSIDGNAGPVFSKTLQLFRDNHPEFIDMTALKEKALEVVRTPLTGYTLKPEDFRFITNQAPGATPAPVRKKGGKTAGKDEVEPPVTYAELTSAPTLLYRSAWEFVAERYHCDEVFLRNLNPRIKNPQAGTGFQVPNVTPFEIEKAFDGTLQPEADPANPVTVALVELSRLEVSRGGKVIAVAPVGFARPGLRGSGSWTIHQAIPLPKLATLQEPKDTPKAAPTVLIQTTTAGSVNPTAPPDAPASAPLAPASRAALASEQFIAEGPNNPVGLVWLNLSRTKTKEALPYGLHGTSIPRRIKSQEGIGGIRLTNWDLIRMVRLIPAETQMQWK
ncbi:LysM peptidoglycan-binding domain-containing protein [Roseimicrobium sp. ORNL1]|uniref:LysM peptidoglycan-binding domain-containing protein n=1 Tax=Roseimicrobium sp. ORNL1 TaxID=2711231 RepID=UPI00197E440E|nr:LysM peptidoglycan-binding domain-containing protein [Roseimicrobium sp. ORNL1]